MAKQTLEKSHKRAANADIVILVEATPAALSNLKPFGWDKRFPYALGDPSDGFTNTAVYSRFPLSHSQLINDTSFQQWVTTARVPQIGSVRLMAVHPCNPYCGGRWSAEHRLLRKKVIDNLDRPLVVAGDFNAVDDHGPMQALRRRWAQERHRRRRSRLAPHLSGGRSVAAVAADRSCHDQQRVDCHVGGQLLDHRHRPPWPLHHARGRTLGACGRTPKALSLHRHVGCRHRCSAAANARRC